MVENVDLGVQGVVVAGPLSAKSPRIENSILEGLRASLKEEIPSEIRDLLAKSQKDLLKLLKPKTKENVREQDEAILEGEPREFYTPTRTVRINSTQNDDMNINRNDYTKNR